MRTDDRVYRHTNDTVNERIEAETAARIEQYSLRTREDMSTRIDELDREWDVERVLQANASTLAFTGLVLGLTRSPRWFLLPGLVLPFLFQHAVQGWCPPIPIIRRLGVRTREEIDREKYALKALRGDFDLVPHSIGSEMRARAVTTAVNL